jgi:hypothetical protein
VDGKWGERPIVKKRAWISREGRERRRTSATGTD